MKNVVDKIIIIPGKFIEKNESGYVIRCLIDGEYTEDRQFEEFSLRGIQNPDLVFIGIMTGVGYMQANFCQANEFRDLFEKHWNVLLK